MDLKDLIFRLYAGAIVLFILLILLGNNTFFNYDIVFVGVAIFGLIIIANFILSIKNYLRFKSTSSVWLLVITSVLVIPVLWVIINLIVAAL